MGRLRVLFALCVAFVCFSLLSAICFASESDSGDFVDTESVIAEYSSVGSFDASVSATEELYDAVELSSASGNLVGCYFNADCALGNGMYFYVSPDKIDYLRVDDDGYIFNCSDGTVYLAVVGDVSTYSISASRFSRFVYRADGFSSSDLMLRANDSTVLPSATSSGSPLNPVTIIIVCFGLFVVALAVLRRSFAYG